MSPFELGTDGPGSILVGIDGSTTSVRAGWYAAGLARRQRANLTVVYVVRASTMRLGVNGSAAAAVVLRTQAQIADDVCRGAVELFGEWGVPMTFITTRGDPFTELCRVAEEVRADAVVVGASAHAAHRLVGSLAVRLLKAGRWPVTVVP
jgi:nucleotide-binding universal stress UspA family protein